MTNPVFAEDDDGYYGYVETSHDPGYSLVFATILFCIISYCSLPFLVAMGNRLDVKNSHVIRKRRPRKSRRQQRRSQRRQLKLKPPCVEHDEDEEEEEDDGLFFEAEEHSADPILEGRGTTPGGQSSAAAAQMPADDDRSFVSARSNFTLGGKARSVSSIASFHSHRTRKRRNRNQRQMEKRHDLEEFELRMQRYDTHLAVDTNAADADNQQQQQASSSQRHNHARDSSPERSVMGPIDHDEVSMDDAISAIAASPTRHELHNRHHQQQQAILMASPHKSPARAPHPSGGSSANDLLEHDQGFWDTLLDLVVCDFESKRLLKLAIPFATQAFSTGILDMITVAVIGKVLGTKEVSAFVVVRTLVDITSSFFGGFHESIATLCSQALGRHNHKLVGQYVQLSMLLYVICYIPFIILWWIYMPAIMLWLGFDQDTADIGQEYSRVYLFLELLDGVDESIHGLLDVIDLESYSTLIGVSHEFVTFLDILLVTLFAKPSLLVVGYIELFVSIIFIAINVGTIMWRGWFHPYREGLVGCWAFSNKPALKIMLSTAGSLSFGYLLTDGEVSWWGYRCVFELLL